MYGSLPSMLGFVNPISSFLNDDGGGGGHNYDQPYNKQNENGLGHEGLLLNMTKNASSHSLCYLFMSETAANGSSGAGLLPHHPFYHTTNNFDNPSDNDEAPGGGWETPGNPHDWTLGGAGNSESSNSQNNFNPHYQLQNNYRGGLSAVFTSGGGSNTNYQGGGDHVDDRAFCPVDWDDILCWPRTPAGEVATLPCFDNLYGIRYNASGELVHIKLV